MADLWVGCRLPAGRLHNRCFRIRVLLRIDTGKKILIIVALFFAISCGATAITKTSMGFISARLFGGLAVGAASVLSPMYVAEVSPARNRGTLVSIYQLTIVLGILISYTINYWLHDVDNNWRWMFATGMVPSVLFFAGLFFIPESPRWLYKAGRKEDSLGYFQE